MAEDPFPRERVGATLRRMPAYLKLSWRLARDPLLSRARRATVIAAAGYLASPIDLVPGVIPVVGQLDDIAFAIAAIKIALSGLDLSNGGLITLDRSGTVRWAAGGRPPPGDGPATSDICHVPDTP